MLYQIIASEKEKSIIIVLHEKLKPDHFVQMAREAGNVLSKNRWSRIIMDARACTSLFSTVQGRAQVRLITDHFPAQSRLALLTHDLTIQDVRLIAQFVYNDAIILDAFSDVEEAIEWLFQNGTLTTPTWLEDEAANSSALPGLGASVSIAFR